MATVYSRPRKSGGVSWYTKQQGPDGVWRPLLLKGVKTGAAARKLAGEIETETERRNHGLEPGALFKGTFAELCQWAIKVHMRKLRGAQAEESRLTCHVIGDPDAARTARPWIGQLPAEQVTAAQLERLFSEIEDRPTVRGKPPSPGTLNRLRLTLSSVFAVAQRHGLWGADNPAQKTQEREVPERDYETLGADEIFPVLEQVPDYWRGCCAVALLAGLRKGEIFGLQKRDVDLERRQLRVSRSHEHTTTKGGHVDTVPIHEGLVSYIVPWLKSPSAWLFPTVDGKQRGRNLHIEKIFRSAMVKAGIVEGYLHKCRRRGCGFSTMEADDARRSCPECHMLLWPVGVPRHVRFHDARHTLASQALMQGASLQGVQAILRHKDPRLTIKRYGHLTQGFLADELNRVQMPGIAKRGAPSDVQSSAVGASEHPASRRILSNHPPSSRGAPMVRGLPTAHHGPTNRSETEPKMLTKSVEPRGIEPLTYALRKQANAIAQDDPGHISSTLLATGSGPTRLDPPQVDPVCDSHGAPMVHGLSAAHHKRVERIGHRSRPTTEQLLTVAQVAARLHLSKAWVYRALERGEIASVRVGYRVGVLPEALDAYLAFRELTAPTPATPSEAELEREVG